MIAVHGSIKGNKDNPGTFYTSKCLPKSNKRALSKQAKHKHFRSNGSGEIFKVFTIDGQGGHVDYVTQLNCIKFHSHFLVPNLVPNRPTVFEKTSFTFEI